MKFKVTGSIDLKEGKRRFEKEVEAKSESHARHTLYALFGSHNGLPRANVRIDGISKV